MTSHPKSPGMTGDEAGLFSISSSFSSSSSYRGLFQLLALTPHRFQISLNPFHFQVIEFCHRYTFIKYPTSSRMRQGTRIC